MSNWFNLKKENKNIKEQLEMLVKDNEENQKIIIELDSRISKAVTFIEKNCGYSVIMGIVKDILKGEEK